MSRLSELRLDLKSGKFLRAASFGWLMAAVLVIHCLALSTIVFSGPLAPFAVQGAGMMLFGGVVFCLVAGVASSYPGILACPQEVPATVLGTLGAAVAAGTAGAPGQAAFMTMAAMLVASGLLTGAFFLAVGRFRLAGLFRFIPYPVAGGFFAGTGWVLSLAALSVMSGTALDWQSLPRLFDASVVWKWVPGAAYGLVLAAVMRRRGNLAVMMGSVVLAGALYHLGLVLLDIPVDDATARGLLFPGMPDGGLWPAFGFGDLGQVDWGVVARQVPNLLTVTLVTLLCLLVYVNGLEVATGVEVDLDREFRVAGLAGMCAGAGGSAPGCQSFVFTLPCRAVGVDSPWNGVVVALVAALFLFFGSGLLEWLPVSIVGGLLLYVGLDLLDNWLIRVRGRLHWTDYGLVLLICAVIAVFGFIEGVAAGMLATLALFAVRLSRLDAVAEEFAGDGRRSTRVRSVPDRVLLRERAAFLRGFRMRGYLFFGSVHPLADRLGQALGGTPAPRCILLDFSAVSGCDLSAVNVLGRFVRSAISAGVQVVVSAASPELEENLRHDVPAGAGGGLRFEPDLDHGLERCEDAVIALAEAELSGSPAGARGRLLDRSAAGLERYLEEQIHFEDLLERLGPWLEPREYEAGETITVRGEPQDGLQFLAAGRVSVHDADGARSCQCGPGDVLEPRAAFAEYAVSATATAIAFSPCRAMVLTPDARAMLESDDGELCLRLFAFLVRRSSRGGTPVETIGRMPAG